MAYVCPSSVKKALEFDNSQSTQCAAPRLISSLNNNEKSLESQYTNKLKMDDVDSLQNGESKHLALNHSRIDTGDCVENDRQSHFGVENNVPMESNLYQNNPGERIKTNDTYSTDNKTGHANLEDFQDLDELDMTETQKPEIEPLLRYVCSEKFLETFGEAVAELASGSWGNILRTNEQVQDSTFLKARQCIAFCDMALMDLFGVDIEVAPHRGVVCIDASSWQHDGAKNSIRALVQTVATCRFKLIQVFVVVDTIMSPQVTADICALSSSVLLQTQARVQIQITSPCLLSYSLAIYLTESVRLELSEAEEMSLTESYNIQDKITFLLAMAPSFSLLSLITLFRHLFGGTEWRRPFENASVQQLTRVLCHLITNVEALASLEIENIDVKPLEQFSRTISSSLR